MDTARIDICYRPLRIAFVVHSRDLESFRKAVRTNCALWGGCFNPLVFADQPEQARHIVETFRCDFLMPVGASEEVKTFVAAFPHLINPFHREDLFFRSQNAEGKSQVLDIVNLMHHWRDKPEWQALKEQGFRRVVWDDADPLADSLLLQFGAYPSAGETARDYLDDYWQATSAIDLRVGATVPISAETLQYPSIRFVSRWGLRRHHSVRAGWSFPGFFIGDVTDAQDLGAFWNLRAADIPLFFIDLTHIARVRDLIPILEQDYRQRLGEGDGPDHQLALWSRSDTMLQEARPHFTEGRWTHCRVSETLWNGHAVRPPMMMLGDASSLGVVGEREGRPAISFTLTEKPHSSHAYFYSQTLVASVMSFGGTSSENATFLPPYVPELNDFLARHMYVYYDRLRVEPDRLGVLIDATQHDINLRALSNYEFISQVFGLAGLKSKISNAGLIARQVIAKLGGADGGRVFKIPGARRLLKMHGPNKSFTRNVALNIIGSTPRFEDHERLYIEPRPMGGPLTKAMVFGYMVEKGLFRTGMELTCPSCNLPSWYPLDSLHQTNTCELCGNTYDATRSMIGRELQYRRSGILGVEKNNQGAVPVVLLLQQLKVNLHTFHTNVMQAVSHDLAAQDGVNLPPCETDFVIIEPDTYPEKAAFVVGECKDENERIDADDIEKLRQIAEAIPSHRFESYILLARLSPFDQGEINLARSLNTQFRRRVILLSARELEPYHIYDKIDAPLRDSLQGSSISDLADATHVLYFQDQASEQPPAGSTTPETSNANTTTNG